MWLDKYQTLRLFRTIRWLHQQWTRAKNVVGHIYHASCTLYEQGISRIWVDNEILFGRYISFIPIIYSLTPGVHKRSYLLNLNPPRGRGLTKFLPPSYLVFAGLALFRKSFRLCMSSVGIMNMSLAILVVFQSREFRKNLYSLFYDTFPINMVITNVCNYMRKLIYS